MTASVSDCRIFTTRADIQHSDLVSVYSVKVLEVVGNGVNIAHALLWVFQEVGVSFTSSLEGRILGDCCEASIGKFLCVYLGNLLL